jgi:aminopeptidase N
LFGREIFREGVKTYFAEFSWKNTQLVDFVNHFDKAAIKHQHAIDFKKWSNTWLYCAGPNIIWHDVTEENGKITKFTVQQRVHEQGTGNQLRVQKYKCAFYDQDMKVTKVIDIVTQDDNETFDIAELVGEEAPFAYHINYQNKGYAKFKIDEKSTNAFETHLGKIEDPLSRK